MDKRKLSDPSDDEDDKVNKFFYMFLWFTVFTADCILWLNLIQPNQI